MRRPVVAAAAPLGGGEGAKGRKDGLLRGREGRGQGAAAVSSCAVVVLCRACSSFRSSEGVWKRNLLFVDSISMAHISSSLLSKSCARTLLLLSPDAAALPPPTLVPAPAPAAAVAAAAAAVASATKTDARLSPQRLT